MITSNNPRKVSKVHRLVARVSEEDRAIIAQAAAIAGQTVSVFVLTQARQAALETFDTHSRIVLNTTESRRFVDALLSAPRRPNARMLKAMELHDKSVVSDV